MTDVTTMLPQPTLPGKVHGVIALDPITVQCDGCGAVRSHRLPILAVGWAIFNPRLYRSGNDRRRLCPPCRIEAAWPT